MGDRSLGRLVVQLAAEVAQYRRDWNDAVNTTKDGATRVEQATRGMDSATGKLKETLERQAGAFGRTAGTAMEYAGAAQAATGISTGLATGIGALVVVLGAAAVAARKGEQEQKALNDSLLLTGNYAGLVSGQLDRMAVRTAASIGGSVGTARQVLAGLVSTGRFTVESLDEVGAAVQLVARYSGQTNEQVLKDFAGMADGVAKWAAKSNEAYHFLDLATFEYIKQLEEQGRKQEAMRVTSDALGKALGDDLTRNLGLLDRALHTVSTTWDKFWAAAKGIGKDPTAQDEIARLDAQIELAQNAPAGRRDEAAVRALQAKRFALQGLLDVQAIEAQVQSENAQAQEKAIAASTEWDKVTDRLATSTERLNKQLAQMRDNANARLAATSDPAARARIEQDLAEQEKRLRAQFAGKASLGGGAGGGGGADRYDALIRAATERVAMLKRELDGTQKLSAADQALARYEADLAAGYIKFNEVKDQRLRAQLAEQKAGEDAVDLSQRESAAVIAAAQAHAKYLGEVAKATDRLDDETEKEEEHAKTLGMSKTAVAELVAEKLEDKAVSLELQAIRAMDKDLDQATYDALMRQAEATRKLAQAKREGAAAEDRQDRNKQTLRDLDQIDDTARRVFSQVAADGGNAFEAVGRSLKANVYDLLYQMTVRRWVISLYANMTGAPAGAVSQAMGGGGGMGGMGGMGNLGGLFSSGMSFSNMAGTAYANATGTGIDGLLATNGAYGTAAGGASGFAGAVGTIGSAMPYIGALYSASQGQYGQAVGMAIGAAVAGPIGAVVGAVLGSLVDSFTKGGGPKSEGYFNPYSESPYFSGPNSKSNAASKTAAQALQAQYDALVTGLGGNSALKFGLGFSTDPAGDAPTMLRIGAGSGGKEQFRLSDNSVGRSEQELQAAIADMSSRAVLKGLQGAGLEGILGDYVKKLGDVAKLSADTVTQAVARLQKAAGEKQGLDARIFELTATDAEKLAKVRDAEIKAIDETNRALLARVYTLEDEKIAAATLSEALAKAKDSARSYADFIGGVNANIRGYIDRLNASPAGMLPPQQQLANAKTQFNQQMKLARAGDRGALEGITGYADQLIAAQTAFSASGGGTAGTIADIKKQLASLPKMETGEEYLARVIRETSAAQVAAISGSGTKQVKASDRLWDGLWGTAGLLVTNLKTLDTSLDGLLNFNELKAAIGPLADDATIRALIAKADKNNDGQLSKLEILNASVNSAGAKQVAAIAASTKKDATPDKVQKEVDKVAKEMRYRPIMGSSESNFDQVLGWQAVTLGSPIGFGQTANTGNTKSAEDLHKMGVPGFAAGGLHAGGWRWVGERGRELEFTPPSRIFSHEQSTRMAGSGSPELVAEVRELRKELAALRADTRQQTLVLAEGERRNIAATADVASKTEQVAEHMRRRNVAAAGGLVLA